MLSVLIGVLIICVVGAICFWVIDKFVNDSRLANLLKLLVVLICVGAILQRVLPLAGINWFLAAAHDDASDLDQQRRPRRFYFGNW